MTTSIKTKINKLGAQTNEQLKYKVSSHLIFNIFHKLTIIRNRFILK